LESHGSVFPEDDSSTMNRLSLSVYLFLGSILLRAFLGFDGLDQQGLRCVDEGYYAFQGWSITAARPGAVWNKPAHDILVAISYKAFGFSMSAPLLMSGFLGMISVFLFYRLGQRWSPSIGPSFTALVAAACPYLLFYSRSAYSETSYLIFTLWGLLLHLRVWDQKGSSSRGNSWSIPGKTRISCATGWIWGIAFSANPAAIAPIGASVLASFLLTIWEDKHLPRPLILHLLCVAVFGVGTILAILLPFQWLGMLHTERYISSVTYHALTASLWSPTFQGPIYLVKFGLGTSLILSIPGTIYLWETRGKRGLFLPLMGLFLLLFYLRFSVTYPRIFLPLVIPVILLAGPGMVWCQKTLQSILPLTRPEWLTASTCLLISLFLGPTVLSALKQIPPQSGYAEACEWLMDDEGHSIITTHSWWTFLAFAACRPAFVNETGDDTGSETLERIFSGEDHERRWLDFLRHAYGNGTSHLVLDYLLWNKLSPTSQERLEGFMKEFPPDVALPNPVARHLQTYLEDGNLPDLSDIPLSWKIYIYRLSRFDTNLS